MKSSSTRRSSLKKTKLTVRDLVGGWLCERWTISYADGRVSKPFGDRPQGYILYTADGHMSATIMAAGRRAFAMQNPREASDQARAEAFDSYFSYAGRWRLRGGRVEHHVTIALNPQLIGSRQLREAKLSGQRLTLAAEETTASGHRRHEIVWRRVPQTSRGRPSSVR